MGIFEFILILVVITSGTKIITEIGAPLIDRLLKRGGERDLERLRAEAREAESLSGEALDELEQRLARIEDRLAFLEELKAPAEAPRLPTGSRDHEPR